MAANSQGVF